MSLHNEAAELRARFEVVRRQTTATQLFESLLRDRKFTEAARIANALGEPLPRNQVVRIDFVRPRTPPKPI